MIDLLRSENKLNGERDDQVLNDMQCIYHTWSVNNTIEMISLFLLLLWFKPETEMHEMFQQAPL